jgi:hypothetical protein
MMEAFLAAQSAILVGRRFAVKRPLLLLVVLVSAGAARAQAPKTFAGTWETTYGRMTLTQQGKKVEGFYLLDGQRCPLRGQVEKKRLTFTYEEPDVKGEGWFELAADGNSFAGKWRARGDSPWGDWKGERVGAQVVPAGFGGLWTTSYSRMRLTEKDGRVQGIYGPGGASTIDGKREGKKLTFRYKEPDAAGEARFELSADGKSFRGKWKQDGRSGWADWTGSRVEPVPGRVWLVVLEANWERDLSEQEYQFGTMLRAFFARSAKVQVRHRFFTDAANLSRWCREVAYLAEPVVLCVATHATPKGVTVDGKTIGADALANALRHCDNLRLLHFSACLIMKDRLAAEMVAALDGRTTFPISGYSTTVDWAASAIIEFLYFDLILLRGMTPENAEKQLGKLLPFAGDKRIPGAVLPPAGFRLLLPKAKAAAK